MHLINNNGSFPLSQRSERLLRYPLAALPMHRPPYMDQNAFHMSSEFSMSGNSLTPHASFINAQSKVWKDGGSAPQAVIVVLKKISSHSEAGDVHAQ